MHTLTTKRCSNACINMLVSGSLPLHSDRGLHETLEAMTANDAVLMSGG